MAERSLKEDDPLEDFAHRELTFDGAVKIVHATGTGPAVIVMAEMPGISPHVARFARWVRDAGFTVYMPSLFGRDGEVQVQLLHFAQRNRKFFDPANNSRAKYFSTCIV